MRLRTKRLVYLRCDFFITEKFLKIWRSYETRDNQASRTTTAGFGRLKHSNTTILCFNALSFNNVLTLLRSNFFLVLSQSLYLCFIISSFRFCKEDLVKNIRLLAGIKRSSSYFNGSVVTGSVYRLGEDQRSTSLRIA